MNKKDLGMLLEQPIAFHPVLARAAGSAVAGLFLSQLFYWHGKGMHQDGWIYKDWQEWHEETCLTQDEQRGARRLLEKKGLIEVSSMRELKIDKFKPTLCFRINFNQLIECIQHANYPESPAVEGDGNFPSRDGNSPPRRAENPTPECRKSHPGVPKIPLLCTENTSETTTENTSETTTTTSASETPAFWLEALEVEVENQRKLKGVTNEDGLRTSILKRYFKNMNGPGPGVLKQLKQLEAGQHQPASFDVAQSNKINGVRHTEAAHSAVCKGIQLLLEAKPETQQEIFCEWQRAPNFQSVAKRAKTLEDALADSRLRGTLGSFEVPPVLVPRVF